ncbi:mycothiol synthase [Isoptericola jiangsuensis]|uniref:mycothiol synthase n=1 Tax=Isoptericola jiangsuensis TaxID=548579 RepID=UPI003AAB05B6
MSAPLEIGPLAPATQDAVRALAAAAAAHDGVAPLSEQPLLNLGVDDAAVTHALVRGPAGDAVAYLQVDRGGDVASAELVVHPAHRRAGTGTLLLGTAERDARLPERSGAPDQRGKPLRVWAHGDLESARGFAAARGYTLVRELLFLARPLTGADAPPAPDAPGGITLRTFRPGDDDEAWVALNARAFADHPEQGRLTVDDLHRRMAEPWFDADGLWLAQDEDGTLAGSIWTKIPTDQPQDDRDGEIYAVGVSPQAQGRGIGGFLTAVGLHGLRAAGCTRAVLYVDGDNAAALATYARTGFTRAAVDTQYAPAARAHDGAPGSAPAGRTD